MSEEKAGRERGQEQRRGRPSEQDTGTMAHHDDLAMRLGQLARSLQAEDDQELMLDEVIRAAVELVPGADHGSISRVVNHRKVIPEHFTGPLPVQVELAQTELGQGPCLDSIYEQMTVRLSDTATDQRWPQFSRRASALGVGSMLAIQLYVDGDNLGSLNLFAALPDAFNDESEHIGLLFAAHAAIAWAGSHAVTTLHQAVASRDVIGQAKGILMERHQLSADQAFRVLTRVSQHENRKLREVAEDLTATGALSKLPRTNQTTPPHETAGPRRTS